MSAAGFSVARSHDLKDGAELTHPGRMEMHDVVHHNEVSVLSLEDDKTSLSTGRLDWDCPYKNLYIYVLKSFLDQSYEFQLGGAFMGNWVEEDTSFLFFSHPADEEVNWLVHKIASLKLIEKHVFSYENWQGGPLERVFIGDFVIVPPWLEGEVPETRMKMILDPGVVFGNCLHPTTRDCLRALSLVARRDCLGQVLDLGTGSGVLSVAARMLGADGVIAVDLNPLCVKTAEKNVMLNGLDNIRVVEGDARVFAQEPADVVVANIHHSVMKEILAANASRKRLRLIASGLMRTQAGEVKDLLRNAGFSMVREWDDQMIWYTLLAERGV